MGKDDGVYVGLAWNHLGRNYLLELKNISTYHQHMQKTCRTSTK